MAPCIFRFASAKVETVFKYTKRLDKNFQSFCKISFLQSWKSGIIKESLSLRIKQLLAK